MPYKYVNNHNSILFVNLHAPAPGPFQPPIQRVPRSLSEWYNGQRVRLIAHLHLVTTL